MATSSAQKLKREPRRTPGNVKEPEESLGTMQEPVAPMEHRSQSKAQSDPAPERFDHALDSDLAAPRTDRGFTMTLAIAAVVLLVSFMVALFLGTQALDDAPSTAAVEKEAPASGNATTGSGGSSP
jgi:predicted secreted protein